MKDVVSFVFVKMKKKNSFGLVSSGGRNFLGRICVYHRGGGKKFRYLLIDRFRRLNQFGFVYKTYKQPSFTAFVGLIIYDNGLASFIILSHGTKIGSRVFSGTYFSVNRTREIFSIGSSNCLKSFGLFSVINSLELFPFSGSKIARSAGVSAYIIGKDKNSDKALIKLGSGWQLKVFLNCISSSGISSNPLNRFKIIGKAGNNRLFGKRPVVRGVVKNPCDHPHGGGEGKGSPPSGQVSP